MKPFCFMCLSCFISANLLFSQPNSFEVNKDYYNVLDSLLLDVNKVIYNGLEYVDKYRCLDTNDHKFYENYSFFNGTVVYAGEPYFNLKLKYSLLDDLVVLEFVNEKVNLLQLNSSLVESFYLNNSKFVRLPINDQLAPFYGNGFFKEIHNKNSHYRLYLKYKKRKFELINDNKVYYRFSEKITYILWKEGEFYKINSKKDIIRAIPDRKKTIQDFYNKYRQVYNEGLFYEKLFNQLNTLVKLN